MININDANLKKSVRNIIYKNKPNTIIILHSYIETDIEVLDSIFRDNYKCGMFPYHFYVRKSGEIYKGRDIECYVPNLNKIFDNMNDENNVENVFNNNLSNEMDESLILNEFKDKIFICIEGDTNVNLCSEEQYNSIIILSKYIKSLYDIRKVYGFNEIEPKYNNPGRVFRLNEVKSKIDNIILPVSNVTPAGDTIYTYGIRILKYNKDNIMHGNDITLLQIYLIKLGYSLKANGKFDLITENVIKQFQKKMFFEANGIVDSKVYEKINKLLNNNLDSDFKTIIKYKLPFMKGEDIKVFVIK